MTNPLTRTYDKAFMSACTELATLKFCPKSKGKECGKTLCGRIEAVVCIREHLLKDCSETLIKEFEL